MTWTEYAAAFAGQWEDPFGAELSIEGTVLTGADGRTLELSMKSEGVCSFQRGINVYEGKLSEDGNSLCWPGDIIWVRKQASLLRKHNEARRRPVLTIEKALALQRELFQGFSDPDFQQKLKALETSHGNNPQDLANERSQLFLTVQSPILPNYGFEASQKGVIDMLEAGASFNNNAEYRRNRDDLNQLLGLVDMDLGLEVVARHVFEDVELKLTLPRKATFQDMKKAISKQLGSEEILEKGRLVKREERGYAPYRDEEEVGSVRQVFVFRASLRAAEAA